MSTATTATFTFDLTGFRRGLDDLGRHVIPKSLANALNDMHFGSNAALNAEVLAKVDRPNNYTKKAFQVTKARYQDGDNMFSKIEVKRLQAQWMHYLITKEPRRGGDFGAGRHDILAYSDQPTSIGGTWKPTYVSRIIARNKTEKRERAALRALRLSFRTANPRARMPDALKWKVKSNNRPGVVFMELGGIKGYYNRPQRLKTSVRSRAIGAARSTPGHISTAGPRGGSSMSWTRPGSKPKLLLGFQDETVYDPLIDYNRIIAEQAAIHLSQANVERHLALNRAWHITHRGGRIP